MPGRGAMRAATSSSAGMASSSIPVSAFLVASFTMPNRVSNVEPLGLWIESSKSMQQIASFQQDVSYFVESSS